MRLLLARQFDLDARRIREWKRNKTELVTRADVDGKRDRLSGGGRKKLSEELETNLCQWIHEMRERNLRVPRRMIRDKATEMNASASDRKEGDMFGASRGWLCRHLCPNNFSLPRRSTVAQKDK